METVPKKKTVDDLIAIPEEERAELINGEIYFKSPPVMTHSLAVTELLCKLDKYAERFWLFFKSWTHYDEGNSLVHDITATWKKDLPEIPWDGPSKARPFWVCEVLSPDSTKNDLERKRLVLERHGVPFYWIASTEYKTIAVYRQINVGEPYSVVTFACRPEDKIVKLPPFEDVELDLSRIFPGTN